MTSKSMRESYKEWLEITQDPHAAATMCLADECATIGYNLDEGNAHLASLEQKLMDRIDRIGGTLAAISHQDWRVRVYKHEGA